MDPGMITAGIDAGRVVDVPSRAELFSFERVRCAAGAVASAGSAVGLPSPFLYASFMIAALSRIAAFSSSVSCVLVTDGANRIVISDRP